MDVYVADGIPWRSGSLDLATVGRCRFIAVLMGMLMLMAGWEVDEVFGLTVLRFPRPSSKRSGDDLMQRCLSETVFFCWRRLGSGGI